MAYSFSIGDKLKRRHEIWDEETETYTVTYETGWIVAGYDFWRYEGQTKSSPCYLFVNVDTGERDDLGCFERD